MKKFIYIMIVAVMLMGCDFAYKKHITGIFYLIAIDSIDDLMLSYYTGNVYKGIVGGGVYKVSMNDKYFVVKRHPYIDDNSIRLQFDKTECYIVEISNEDKFFDEERKCHGPYDEEQLPVKLREFNIDNLEVFYERKGGNKRELWK